VGLWRWASAWVYGPSLCFFAVRAKALWDSEQAVSGYNKLLVEAICLDCSLVILVDVKICPIFLDFENANIILELGI
jgi:hypothetical protein